MIKRDHVKMRKSRKGCSEIEASRLQPTCICFIQICIIQILKLFLHMEVSQGNCEPLQQEIRTNTKNFYSNETSDWCCSIVGVTTHFPAWISYESKFIIVLKYTVNQQSAALIIFKITSLLMKNHQKYIVNVHLIKKTTNKHDALIQMWK